MRTVLRGRVVTGTEAGAITDAVVAFDGPTIEFAGPAEEFEGELPPVEPVLILPGLVDVHCHGGGGFGFPDADEAGVAAAAGFHRGRGTTTLVGSLVSATEAELGERIGVLGRAVDDGLLAGIHLEGPFISVDRPGAHALDRIVPGDPAMLRRLLERADGRVVSVTIAPETENFDELGNLVGEAGAVLSLGHTVADYARSAHALWRGGRISVTHLCNGMPPLEHRHPNFLTAALSAAAHGVAVAEVIGDGVHLAHGTVRMLFDTLGARHIALITDAMAAAGQPDGHYRLGSLDVVVVDGVSRLSGPDGPGAIAGGTASASDVLRHTVFGSSVDLCSAVMSASGTGARLLGRAHRIGTLRPGAVADVLVTDTRLRPVRVYKEGALWNS
ncbi:N-acetylglucosamine-6-phosphate deacetylase [Nocardia aurantia]|uniref:N-acetylglucosamine-6-phosphate deacetylase n=1 Tax=Nocardia aurantia TaxID=2585199 RepID=A0A7K0DKD5_9NOCA|nr:amidohydrolase family protein [Nocardia aurantia]MQY26169.1 N-acetylglucosamine-6-phosphate deacetylase [Nocardia aurantia]